MPNKDGWGSFATGFLGGRMPVWQLMFGFNGRIRRLQWWLGSLMAFGGFLALIFLLGLVIGFSTPRAYGGGALSDGAAQILGVGLIVLYALYLWSVLALAVKRFHDRNHTGFWVLLFLVPLGAIWVLIELGFLDGTQGSNRFGRSPKGIGVHEDLVRTFA